jgi:solute:Na+ symporter, SSS family
VNVHLALLIVYSAALIALGLWIGRRVRRATDFFVAGRQLGPGLLFSTMLAANIGAGSTVGATALGYRDGLAGWWWVGSAALGSLVLAFWIGPAIRRISEAHDLRTVGDFLEMRYGRSVRAIIAIFLWFGSLAILGGQLIAIASILNVAAGLPRAIGCGVGGALITIYFTAGGLMTSAWVNMVQLIVKFAGFLIALPLAVSGVGGWSALIAYAPPSETYWNFWQSGSSGIVYVALLAPSFIVSPGLLQKIYGARDDRAVRLGVGANAVGLFLYAIIPVLLGMLARMRFPTLESPDMALPAILTGGVPLLVGSIGLAAVFSAELSAADAVLFMLTTSLSQDLYRRFVNPAADEHHLLRITRVTAVIAGALGTVVAIVSRSVIDVLSIFYTLLGVSLFVPVLAGLYVPHVGTTEALAAIVAGVGGMLTMYLATAGRGAGVLTPALFGLIAAICGCAAVMLARTALANRTRSVDVP